MKLTKCVVFLAKLPKNGTKTCAGYQDENGQNYVPPRSGKKFDSWKKKLESKGYEFA